MYQNSRTGSSRSVHTNGHKILSLVSDDEEEEDPPQHSQSSRTSWPASDIVELEDSSDEDYILDLERALALSQATARSAVSSGAGAGELLGAPSIRASSETILPTPSIAGKQRKNESNAEVPRKKRRTSDEVALGKERLAREREVAKLNQQLKKDEKEAAKLQAKEAKARERALKEVEKEAKKQYAELNKVISDKKATLADCVVEASALTEQHPIFGQWLRVFGNKLLEYSSKLSYTESRYDFPHTLQWRRLVNKEFDEELREWRPVDTPYEAIEPMIALFYNAEDFIKKLRSNRDEVMEDIGILKMKIDEEFGRLGSTPDTGMQRPSKEYQIFVIITGAQTYCNGRPREYKDAFSSFSVRVNVHHRAHVITCETRHEMCQRLFDISADLGIKPYKLIKRSHLPYVSDTAVTGGSTSKETYRNMLMKLHKFTRPVADAVISHKPTLNQLMTAYAQVGHHGEREHLFEQVVVQRSNKGGHSAKSMNVSLSKRLHKSTFGLNPFAFVGPDSAARMHH